jgi:hypothetical protein
MNAKRAGYALSSLIGSLLGGFFGFVASMWGGIEVIVPGCAVLGAMFGIAVAYVIELIILGIY